MTNVMNAKFGLSHRAAAICTAWAGALAITVMLCLPSSAAVVERSLAGIKIFSHSSAVLKKYGTPDEVRIGSQASTLLGNGNVAGPSGQGGSTGSGGGAPGEFGGGPGAPGVPPSPGGPAGASGTTGTASQYQTVTWVYDRPDGSSLEFTLSSDGRVVQIHASGYKSSVRTARGAVLGMQYKDVMAKYSYPEAQNYTGKFLNLNYSQRCHCAFQFYNQKLVGIIVAAVD